MKYILEYSHIVVSILFTLGAYFLGFDALYSAFIISAYWTGREVSQAEERFIHTYTPNKRRSEMPVLTAYYNPKAWNVKSFWQDMTIPFILSVALALYLQYGGISQWL